MALFPTDLALRTPVLITDKLLIHNITTGVTEYTTVEKLLASLSELESGQLKFPAVQIPSADVNTLDDYEEGTWTPVLTRFTTPSGHTYVSQEGTYTKIGNRVIATFLIVISATGVNGTGNNRITGLPFASEGTYANVGVIAYNDVFSASNVKSCYTSGSEIAFVGDGPTQSDINENYKDGAAYISGSINYRTA